MAVPIGPVKPGELLARVLAGSGLVRRSDRSIRWKAFIPPAGTIETSVHRRTHMSSEEAIRYAMETARRRGRSRFYGWAVLSVQAASRGNRLVIDSPGDHPYHADIVLPAEVAGDRDGQIIHAQLLAAESRWVEPPAQLGDSWEG